MKAFILTILLSIVTLFPASKDNTLKDIAKPYLGTYECRSAQIGSKDCLEKFSYICLELQDEENFVLLYQEKGDGKKEVKGKYTYDKEKGVLKLTDKGGIIQREFPLRDGVLTISFPIGEKNMVLQFEQK